MAVFTRSLTCSRTRETDLLSPRSMVTAGAASLVPDSQQPVESPSVRNRAPILLSVQKAAWEEVMKAPLPRA